MSKYNSFANKEDMRKRTRAWVRETCPLVYVFAPSNEGKTTWLGSLFPSQDKSMPLWTYEHDDYCRVLVIDADQGATTIEHLTGDERLCELRDFDQPASQQLAWFNQQIEYANTADCNAIIIEGLISVHDRLLANELRANSGAVGNELRRAYIGPAGRAKGLIDDIRAIKQNRIAAKRGVPIIVTLNTKSQPQDPTKPDSPQRFVPDWGVNTIDKAMRTSDAHLQLVRDPTGTRLVSIRNLGPHPYCKMRSSDVAVAVANETNLNLPGLLTLWAVTQQRKSQKTKSALDKRDAPEQPTNPTDTSTASGV